MTIQEILDELRMEYREAGGHHHAREGWIQIDCPFCGPDSQSYHLGFNLENRYFHCWRCGHHRFIETLIALGVSAEKARLLFSGINGPEASSKWTIAQRRAISLKIPAGIGPLSPSHRRYLRDRGFDPDEISGRWNVLGIGIAPKLSWRIYIPIFHQGVQVSWTTRAIGERAQPRYLSASAEEEVINHKDLVYGMDFCTHTVVVVEGPVDAWAIGPGAGATFGTAFSMTQVKLLARFPRRFICLDSSHEAQQKAKELAGLLSMLPGMTENILLDAKDPGCASQKELQQLRRVTKL